MKYAFLNIFFAILCSIFSCQGKRSDMKDSNTITSPENKLSNPKKSDTLTITATGDNMIGSGFPSEAELPGDDAVGSYKNVKEYLKGDVVFANLEGCFLNSGNSEKCKGKSSGSCFAFRMPDRYSRIMKEAGFNTVSIANNHVGDFGDVGKQNTAKILDELKIHYAGQTTKPYEIFEINGIKYGFCAFAPNNGCVSINKIDEAKNLVKDLKSKVDIVIVSFHGGAEGSDRTHIPRKNEVFYGENRGNVYSFAHAVIDAGADLVLGHGPHVTRAVELYKNKFIAYSMGNFNTYGMFNLKGVCGISPIMNIKLKPNGDFIKASVTSTKQSKENGLQTDSEHQAFEQIKILTKQDIPETNLKFENNQILIQ